AAVVLDVEAGPVPVGTSTVCDEAPEVLLPDRQLRAGGDDGVDLLGAQRTHRQQRHLLEAAADLRRLAGGGDGEPGRSSGHGRLRAAIGAVTVAVGLDDCTELRPPGKLGDEPRAVGANRVEVDPGERPLHGYSVSATRAASASALVTIPAS